MHIPTSAQQEKLALINKITVIKTPEQAHSFLQKITVESTRRPVTLAFVNAHAFNLCDRDRAFLQDLLACDYILRDGAGMKILYRLLGKNPGLNMNGTDLIPKIIEQFQGQDVALFGTQNPYLQNAADKIARMGVRPAILREGFEPEHHYIEALAFAPVPLIVLAMGMPKQERIAVMMSQRNLFPALIVCGGAILDFMGGKVSRAPAMFRRLGIEWLYRLIQEPKRLFHRYVVGNAVFLIRAYGLSRLDRGSLS